MAGTRTRRILRELEDIRKDKDKSGVFAGLLNEANTTHLEGFIPAPPDTPYSGGIYKIDIHIPDNYPFKPPMMKFTTKIWHPNVSSQSGAICLDTLSSGWSPVGTIKTALLSLRMLLESPNPKDPQDAQVAKMMMEDPEYFKLMAHDWAVTYAGAPRTMPTPSEYQRKAPEKQADDPRRYQGYNRDLVNRFVDMGFELDKVVAAFLEIGIDPRNGQDYELEEAYMGDITAALLGEQ